MKYSNELFQLFFELCNNASKSFAALFLLEEFSAPKTSVRRKNEILFTLLFCYRNDVEPAWCFAVLRLMLYPKLALLEQCSVHTWSEVLSAFWRSCDDYNLIRPAPNAENCLRNMTKYRLTDEARTAIKETKAAKKLHQQAKVFALCRILSGALAGQEKLEREEAKQLLIDWECGGWVLSRDVDDLLERACPQKKNHSPAERQRQTRAKSRFGAKLLGHAPATKGTKSSDDQREPSKLPGQALAKNGKATK